MRVPVIWCGPPSHQCLPCVQDNNPVERTWGEPRHETGLPNHVDLVHMLDLVDLEKGQEVAGSRGYYLKGPVRVGWGYGLPNHAA
jgi:seryl-tRNA synthetase